MGEDKKLIDEAIALMEEYVGSLMMGRAKRAARGCIFLGKPIRFWRMKNILRRWKKIAAK